MAMSDYLEKKLLDHVYGGSAFTQPSSWYVALFTSDPADDASGTEVSGGGYQRTAYGPTVTSGTSPQAENASDITFPQATADWGTVTHVAIFDAQTGGNMLDYGPLTQSVDVQKDGVFKILAGDLTVSYT